MATNSSDVNVSTITTMMTTTTTVRIEQYFGLSFYIFVVECCLSPFILFGNRLTVVIVTRYLKKFTPTHVAATYLAVADFTVGMMPWFHLTTYLTQDDSKFWRNWCKFAAWFDNVLTALNITAVMFIAVERCFLITKWDLYQKHYTVKKQKMITAVSASVFSMMITAKIALSKLNPNFGKCYHPMIFNLNDYDIIPCLFFVIISFVLVLSYIRIIYFLWKRRKSAGSLFYACKSESICKREEDHHTDGCDC